MFRPPPDLKTVGIISYGGKKTAEFTARLNNLSSIPRFTSRDYTETSNKVLMIQLGINSYKKQKHPLILLLDREFLEHIWTTEAKKNILNDLLTYTSKYFIHVWFDLSDEEVEKYSVQLSRRDFGFRKVNYSELEHLSDNQLNKEILSRLIDTKAYVPRNYSVQDENHSTPSIPSEIGLKFSKDILDISSKFPLFDSKWDTSSLPSKRSSSSKLTGGSISITPSEKPIGRSSIASSTSSGSSTRSNSTSSATSSTSKKKGKKKKDKFLVDPSKLKVDKHLLKDLSTEQKGKIAKLLDVGYGANWKQIAAYYDVTGSEISDIEINKSKEDDGPTQNLFRHLLEKNPDLELKDLQDKCRKICRNDVAEEIMKILQSFH